MKTKLLVIFTIVIVVSVGVLVAVDPSDSSSATTFGFFEDDTKIMIDANNRFAVDLYSEFSSENDDNIFFSPISISTAFAIAYEGARDNTSDEIQSVFGFPQDDDIRRNSFLSFIKNLNEEDKEYELRLANALWLAEGFKPNDEYVTVTRDYYDSELATVDFTSDGVDKINGWVNNKTEGKIEEIFAPSPANAAIQLAITNAIYFKGTWTEQFDPERTRMGDFYTSRDDIVKVPLMELETSFLNFARTDQARIVELPYEGEKVSMLVLIPEEIDGIKLLEESITVDNLKKWREDFQKMKVRVYLPKFHLETTYDMIPVLQEMGIHDAFGDANFGGISDSGLFIDKVIHKAFVEVNEEGTEAAAVTGIATLQSGPLEFRADHPFVFLIQDNESGQILFIGRVMDPTK